MIEVSNNSENNLVSGTAYSYYFLCKRKLWFYCHGIGMEGQSELVAYGKFIDEITYQREKHHIIVDDCVAIDYMKGNIVYEVKKSNKESQMAVNQLKYYMFILKQKGLKNLQGKINYPLLKKTEDVFLIGEDEIQIQENLQIIRDIVKREIPPEFLFQNACNKCAYKELCLI